MHDYFQFKQFTVRQAGCAMKVGTDGTLLGAWARGGQRILDIGTGTGLVALMMAQRFVEAQVVGVDIDAAAVSQAQENVTASPFLERISIELADINNFGAAPFDAIVANPPYFERSLTSPDSQRTLARHTTALSYGQLIAAACRLLADEGEFSVVVPADAQRRIESEAALAGLFKVRECLVKTTPRKAPKRALLAFRKHGAVLEQTVGIIEDALGMRSEWYQQLTNDFYL